ncbi:MAG TPA: hypothetical protein VJO52_05250 [Gemmatimonadaceae bacterium]|nr:hypothetical protein [Gemmatimonadaceae bacterium]
MRTPQFAMLAASALIAAGCNPFHRSKAVELKSTAIPLSSRWTATLATPPALHGALQVQGSAWMAAKDNKTVVSVQISNAAPGGMHPWHVHMGTCGNDAGILGPPGSYGTLKVDGDGKAAARVEVPIQAPTSGQYFVNIHASPTNLGTIIACGNLAPPTG